MPENENKGHIHPLKLENKQYRDCSIIGIHETNGKIVYLHTALEDIPQEQITKDTIFPKHIIADFFSHDFNEQMQIHASYIDKTVFYSSYAKSYIENGRLSLNTLYETPAFAESKGAFAKIFEITDSEIREVSPSPHPAKQFVNEQKTYRFGDYVLRMASEWKMECRSSITDALIWELRLTAWLYSDLEERNGIVYFGTAGKGGHFYGVSLMDGRVIFDKNTGGTVKVAWANEYLAVTDKKGDLILLNPSDGAEIKRFHFKNMAASIEFPILVFRDKLYTVLREKKNYFSMYAVCIKY